MSKIVPINTIEDAIAYAKWNERIVPWAEYGDHINVRCQNHLDCIYSTKNIEYIGARSIFHIQGIECPKECPRKFEPVIPKNWRKALIFLPENKCGFCRCYLGTKSGEGFNWKTKNGQGANWNVCGFCSTAHNLDNNLPTSKRPARLLERS